MVLLLLISSLLPLGAALEMEVVGGGCLQVTLQAGEHMKADPQCIVSRGIGLAIRPRVPDPVRKGIFCGLKRRIRQARGLEERPRSAPLQRLSNTMTYNETDCFFAPPWLGVIHLVEVNSGGSEGETESRKSPSLRNRATSSSSRQSGGRARGSNHRSRPSSSSTGAGSARHRDHNRRRHHHHHHNHDKHYKHHPAGREPAEETRAKKNTNSDETNPPQEDAAGKENYDNEEPRKLIALTQAIVAVGPEVIVKPFSPSGGSRRRRDRGSASFPLQQHKASGRSLAGIGPLSVCEGRGQVALGGYGEVREFRLQPGQKRLVGSSHAIGWTSGMICNAGAGGRGAPRVAGTATSTSYKNNFATNPPKFATFVGPGTVYVQTHSLSILRRLLVPKPGAEGSLHGGVSSGSLGVGGRRPAAVPPRSGGSVVGLSLKRGLAKRTKAGAKRVLLTLSFFTLYLVVYSLATALLLEGRDGIANAPRHAMQVVRSLTKVVRRVATVSIRLFWEEIWNAAAGGRGATESEVDRQ